MNFFQAAVRFALILSCLLVPASLLADTDCEEGAGPLNPAQPQGMTPQELVEAALERIESLNPSLNPSLRADGAGVYTLVRNLGNSAGIAVMQAIYTANVQVVHSRLISPLTQDNPLARAPYLTAPYSLTDSAGSGVELGTATNYNNGSWHLATCVWNRSASTVTL